MSRIGNLPLELPEGVQVTISDSNLVGVKGPKGELFQEVDKDISVKIDGNILTVSRPTEQKRHKSLHGLYRALIANMVEGVSNGYTIKLELIGVGYRASSQGQILEIAVGYSHPIVFELPSEVKVSAVTEKGSPPTIILESVDKQLIGQVAAKIRSYRKPEPYKGKGIKYSDEIIRRKAGKAASAA